MVRKPRQPAADVENGSAFADAVAAIISRETRGVSSYQETESAGFVA